MAQINYFRLITCIIFLSLSSLCCAQFTVNSDGSVALADSCDANLKLKIGDSTSNEMYSNAGLHSCIRNFKEQGNVGVVGEVYSTNYAPNSYASGVCGVAGNAQTGYNYGTMGVLSGYKYGTGIYGTTHTSGNFLTSIDGRYAGYFAGNVKVVGNTYVTGTSYYNNASYYSSDERLKTNIVPLSESKGISFFTDFMKIKTYQFNYIAPDKKIEEKEKDIYDEDYSQRIHYGVIAQELQELFPHLVKEKKEGYLAVNYVELIPLLINAVQELKKEISELKGEDVSMFGQSKVISSIDSNFVNESHLYQNNPNPFKESTMIKFSLSNNIKSASLCIFNMEGKMLKSISLANSDTSVKISSGELYPGMYLYTLIVDGKEIETKRMIVTK